MRSVYGVDENIVDVGDGDGDAAAAAEEAPVSADVGLKLVPLLLLLTYLNVVVFGIAVDAIAHTHEIKKGRNKRISKILIISSSNVCPANRAFD